MDIKMIHDMLEKLTECAKHELDKGIEMLDTKEFGEVTDMIKDLSEAEYYRTITEEMKKPENEYGEDYVHIGAYDNDERRYYDSYRYKSSGRFAPKGRGSYMPRRRGYMESMPMMEEPYRMTLDDYKNRSMEELRDIDRRMGRMYYTDGGNSMSSGGMNSNSSGGNMGGNSGSSSRNYGGDGNSSDRGSSNSGGRDSREGRSGMSRRTYMETKEMHKGNSAEDKQAKMKELEEYMKELSEDLTEMVSDASAEEKTLLRSKLSTLVQKMQ